jgi:hypothetical protein
VRGDGLLLLRIKRHRESIDYIRGQEPQISPLRCASIEMTKERAALPGRDVVGENLPVAELSSRTLVGPAAEQMKTVSVQQLLSLEAPPSPLSSRPKRSEVERSLCGCSFLGMFFDVAALILQLGITRYQAGLSNQRCRPAQSHHLVQDTTRQLMLSHLGQFDRGPSGQKSRCVAIGIKAQTRL